MVFPWLVGATGFTPEVESRAFYPKHLLQIRVFTPGLIFGGGEVPLKFHFANYAKSVLDE
jgi:hypothetical protein